MKGLLLLSVLLTACFSSEPGSSCADGCGEYECHESIGGAALPGGLCTLDCKKHGDCPEGFLCLTEEGESLCFEWCPNRQHVCAHEDWHCWSVSIEPWVDACLPDE